MTKPTQAQLRMAQAMQVPSGPIRDAMMAEAQKLCTPRAKRRHPEDDLQMAVCKYLKLAVPKDCLWFSVPNGAYHNARQGNRLKRTGMVSGIPDLLFLHRGHAYAAELKSDCGTVSDVQRDIHARWIASGHSPVIIVRSLDDMRSALMFWGIIQALPLVLL